MLNTKNTFILKVLKGKEESFVYYDVSNDNAGVGKYGCFPSILIPILMDCKQKKQIPTEVYFYGNEIEFEYAVTYSSLPFLYITNDDMNLGKGIPFFIKTDTEGVPGLYSPAYTVCLDQDSGIFYKKTNSKYETIGSSVTVSDFNENTIEQYNKDAFGDILIQFYYNIKRPSPMQSSAYHMGGLLQVITDREGSDYPLIPDVILDTYEEEERQQIKKLNNYNIGASVIYKKKTSDSGYHTLGISLNEKGTNKSAHAETRILLIIDFIEYLTTQSGESNISSISEYLTQAGVKGVQYLSEIVDFFQTVQPKLKLLSSLKPCYLCLGEVDATVGGFIKQIRTSYEVYTVNAIASYEFVQAINSSYIREVEYFDVDLPITYFKNLQTTVYAEGSSSVTQTFQITDWENYLPSSNVEKENYDFFLNPIGNRIVDDAGKSLKTGYSWLRYKNNSVVLMNKGNIRETIYNYTY